MTVIAYHVVSCDKHLMRCKNGLSSRSREGLYGKLMKPFKHDVLHVNAHFYYSGRASTGDESFSSLGSKYTDMP